MTFFSRRLHYTADINGRAAFEPFDHFRAAVPQSVLDIDLLRRVARKSDIHAREGAVFQRFLPVELVEEVVREGTVTEEQPAAAPCLRGATFLHERTERRDAGARSNHDDVFVSRRQSEMLVRL